jgi:hypothetical protein
VRIVDETLPPDRSARLFKVDPHHDAQVGGELRDGRLKVRSVFAGGVRVVDGAGADEYEEARVKLAKDARNLKARIEDGRGRRFSGGAFFLKKNRRKNDFGPFDAKVFGRMEHGSFLMNAPLGLLKRLRLKMASPWY